MTATTMDEGRRGRRTVRGMPWVTWRQHRVALIGTLTLLGGLGVVLVINGLATHAAYDKLGLTRCGDLAGPTCETPLGVFRRHYQNWPEVLPQFLAFLPLVMGIFVGAPLIARELESGTFRFAWTQGRSRTRWATAKLALLGVTLTVLALGFSLLFTWWYEPWEAIQGRMDGTAYELIGLVFAARTLFGFTLGALLGAVIRRPVPAMAATGVAWLAVAIPAAILLRPRIEKPVSVPADSTVVTRYGTTLDQWVTDPAGHRLTAGQVDDLDVHAAGSSPAGHFSFDAWLRQHHYTQWVNYQPGNRFWTFQTVEASGYLLLALLLAAATLYWLRRRVT